MRHHSPTFKHDDIAEQFDPADGRVLGHVYLGTLPDPVQASARLALDLSGVRVPAAPAPVVTPSVGQRIEYWLRDQRERHGLNWLVVATVLGLLLTLL